MRKKEAREVKPAYHPQCTLGTADPLQVASLIPQGSLRVSSLDIWAGFGLLLWTRGTSGSPPAPATA